MNRRTFLAGLSGVVAGTAGCLDRAGLAGTAEDPTTQTTTREATDRTTHETDDEQKQNEKSDEDDSSSLTDWERSTDCGEEHDSMHDSVVEVAEVRSSIGDGYVPIRFSGLSSGEKDVLRPVTEEGGYGTCEAGEAFHQFVERVTNRQERQEEDRHVYLERDGTYYRLYVEIGDQVFVY